ncbi:unnamed protein product [Heterosigma akashiwo]
MLIPPLLLKVLGRTTTNRPVYFAGDVEELRGKIVKVKITEARAHSLTGVQVTTSS